MASITDKVLKWASGEELVRAVVLCGSQAKNKANPLSDYDFAIFADNYQPFIADDRWMGSIAKVWLYIPEKVYFEGSDFPSRLVIFEEGINADFLFFPSKLVQQLNSIDQCAGGYEILLDKDGRGKKISLPDCSTSLLKKPSEDDFKQLVLEFWFEVYQIAKLIKRDELWAAKARDADVKHRLLFTMLIWHEGAKRNWKFHAHPAGKRIRDWVPKTLWQELCVLFVGLDAKETQESLIKTIDLFRRLSKETARMLGNAYDDKVECFISDYINSIL